MGRFGGRMQERDSVSGDRHPRPELMKSEPEVVWGPPRGSLLVLTPLRNS